MRTPSDKEIVERFEKWFPGAKEYWLPHHERYSRIKRFTKSNEPGSQWDKGVWDTRVGGKSKRITLQENLLGPFVNREVNKLKRSNFAIQVKPKDDDTDVDLAELRQGLHRGIEQIGGWSQMIGQTADDLVTGGLCAARMLTRFADPKTFKKEIKYLAVDPTRMFHGDGSHQEPDFSDVTDSLVYEPYSKAKFKAEFDMNPDDFMGRSGTPECWGSGSTPWVNEYFFADESSAILAMTIDGKEHYVTELKAMLKDPDTLRPMVQADQALSIMIEMGHSLSIDDLIAKDPKTGEPITRETTTCQIWWVKMAGREVLKKEAWPGLTIPNFIGTGRKVVLEGTTYYYGLAEPAIDAQRAHNYAVSAHVERLSYAPKIPIYMPIEGVPKGHMEAWQNINTSNQAVAFYNAFTNDKINPQAIPPPRRENSVQSDPGFLDLRNLSEQGIKGTLGMWESSLSAPSDERSGVAIRARESQADNGNFDWGENLATMAEAMGYATDEILDKLYDVPTQVRIVGEDDKEKVIWAASLGEGEEDDRYFNLKRGKFDILCKMSPGHETKREEALAGMTGLFTSAPQMAEALSDFYIQEQDWRLAPEASKRIKKFLGMKYPGLIEEEGEGKPKIPPEVQQQMQQMQAKIQQMQEQLQKAQQAVQENQSLKIENQSIKAGKDIDGQKLLIEKFKADTDRMKVKADIENAQGSMLLKADELQHDKQIDAVELTLKAKDQHHQEQHNHARFGMDAQKFAHQSDQDGKKTDIAGKMAESKISQQGKPTGASGQSPTLGVKGANS